MDDAVLLRREVEFEPKGARSALLIVDMQNDFCHEKGVLPRSLGRDLGDVAGLVRRINRLAAAAREGDADVVWMRMEWGSDAEVGLLRRGGFLAREGLRRGTWGAALLEGLEIRDSDLSLSKKRFSAFFDTELEDVLRARDVGRLFVAGVRTDYCVESTVRDAFFRDYEVVVVRDCVAGYFANLHENSLTEMGTIFAEVTGSEDALERLAGRGGVTGSPRCS